MSLHPESTATLVKLALAESPDIEALQQCVADGADVTALIPGQHIPILSQFILQGHLEAVQSCLGTPRSLDFTVVSRYFRGRGVLHVAAAVNTYGGASYNQALLEAIVHRIEVHPEDLVNWGKRDLDFMNFLSLAAENQVLHVVWPMVKHMPFFADQLEPIPLMGEVWEWDWNTLTPAEKELLSKDKATCWHQADPHTAKLWKCCTQLPTPDVRGVRECVAAGADVMYMAAERHTCAILSYCINQGLLDVIEVMFVEAPRIDFFYVDCFTRTPLHFIGLGSKNATVVCRLLHLVLDRLEAHPDEAMHVQWGVKNALGHEPISLAASAGYLAVWVKVLFHERPVQYYLQHPGKIRLSAVVKRTDWAQVSEEDRARFENVRVIDKE